MASILIINGSPRAPRSHSRLYARIFQKYAQADTINIQDNNHDKILEQVSQYQHILFVFPLYVDALPVPMIKFLKSWQNNPPANHPVISCIINCGFIEPHQMNVAVEMIQLFLKQNHLKLGSVLKIASGEAILKTPFHHLVKWKIKKLASGIKNQKSLVLQTTMPLPKKVFIKASTRYWIRYASSNHLSQTDMETMDIEKQYRY